MFPRLHTYTRARVHASIAPCPNADTWAYTPTCLYAPTPARLCASMPTCEHTCIHAYTPPHLHAFMPTRGHTHLHTSISTCLLSSIPIRPHACTLPYHHVSIPLCLHMGIHAYKVVIDKSNSEVTANTLLFGVLASESPALAGVELARQ